MVTKAKIQKLKKEGSGKLKGERDQINIIHLGFERWQVVLLIYRQCTVNRRSYYACAVRDKNI